MATTPVNLFEKALQNAKQHLQVRYVLKDKQIETLKLVYEGNDVITVLPTGYGKSLIFQLLPWLLQKHRPHPCVVILIVICPLNSIMQDQVVSLNERAIKACYLNISGSAGTSYEVFRAADSSSDNLTQGDSNQSNDECEAEVPVFSENYVSALELSRGQFNLIYTHPEALVSNSKMTKILRTPAFRRKVGAIVVDEVHMVAEWGEAFRTAFNKISDVNALFPDAVHLACTATLTPNAIKKLSETLQLKDPTVVQHNPDRPNIYIQIKARLPNIYKLDKYDDLIHPLFLQLKEEKSTFPVTFVYVDSLDALWYSFRYLEQQMGQDGYLPGQQSPETRIYAMYHKDYTARMKAVIVNDLRRENPTIRLVLATVALGMGLNAPAVCRIIHYRPPTDLEKYMQEIGRAGRQGQPATATMYFNNSDLASNRPGLSKDLVTFCRNKSTCLRKHLLSYFGFDSTLFSGPQHKCCSNCNTNNEDLHECGKV